MRLHVIVDGQLVVLGDVVVPLSDSTWLAFLAIARGDGAPVSAAKISRDLWPAQSNATASIRKDSARTCVARLRKTFARAFGDELVAGGPDGYTIDSLFDVVFHSVTELVEPAEHQQPISKEMYA